MCEQLFSSPETAEEAAGQLCRIAAHHGFDGWLLNVENTLSETAIPNLLHFIRCARPYETRKYHHSTGKVHAQVLQNLIEHRLDLLKLGPKASYTKVIRGCFG